MQGRFGKTGSLIGFIGLCLLVFVGFLGWVQGDLNGSSDSSTPLILRDLVHPVNLTVVSQTRTPFNDTDYKGVKPLGRNETVQPRSNETRGVVVDDGRLRCYVCSWSIMGRTGNNSENINTCAYPLFDPDRTQTIPCDHGCEKKAFRKTEKDEVRQFYRNCFHPEEGKEVKERCYKTKTIYGIEESCECLSDRCNTSPPSPRRLFPVVEPILLVIVIVTTQS